MGWFLYDNGLCLEELNENLIKCHRIIRMKKCFEKSGNKNSINTPNHLFDFILTATTKFMMTKIMKNSVQAGLAIKVQAGPAVNFN